MKVYTFTLFISAALSIPSLVGSVGRAGSIGSQVKGLGVGKNLAAGIGQVPDVGNAVDGANLRTVGRAAESTTGGIEGGLGPINIGEDVAGDIGNVSNVGREVN